MFFYYIFFLMYYSNYLLSLSLFLLFLFSLHSSSYFLPFILYHIMPILSLPFSSSLFLLPFSLHPSSSSHFFFLYHIMFILPHLILFPFPHSSSSLSCHIILYYTMPCHISRQSSFSSQRRFD